MLELTFQSPAGRRARKNIVRKESIDGPYRNRKVEILVNVPIGSGSGANIEVRKIIGQNLKKEKGEILFYVRAEIERIEKRNTYRYFKTIVARQALPV